jgi:hypothetical protein
MVTKFLDARHTTFEHQNSSSISKYTLNSADWQVRGLLFIYFSGHKCPENSMVQKWIFSILDIFPVL